MAEEKIDRNALEAILEKRGHTWETTKDLIRTQSPFITMRFLGGVATEYANQTNTELANLARGNPDGWVYPHTQEVLEMRSYYERAGGYIALDPELVVATRRNINPDTIDELCELVVNQRHTATPESRMGGKVFRTTVSWMVDQLEGTQNQKDRLKAHLYREILYNSTGSSYGDPSGLDITKLYFAICLKDSDPSVSLKLVENEDPSISPEIRQRYIPKPEVFSRILITDGVTGASEAVFKSHHFDPGDYAICLEPLYAPIKRFMEDADLKVVRLVTEESGELDWDVAYAFRNHLKELKQKADIGDEDAAAELGKYKLFYEIDPDNPTGWVRTEEEKKFIASLQDFCPHLITFTDSVYQGFVRGKTVPYSRVKENFRQIDSRSVSKGEELAGLRIAFMYIYKATEDELREQGILQCTHAPDHSALNYFIERKSDPVFHVDHPSTTAQIQAALWGAHYMMTNHVDTLTKVQLETTMRLCEEFGMPKEEREKKCNYYFFQDIYNYIERVLPEDTAEAKGLKKYILDNFEADELILQGILYRALIFDGVGFFFGDEPLPEKLQETEYARLYEERRNHHPLLTLRGSMLNAAPDTIVSKYQILKSLIHGQIDALKAGYLATSQSRTTAHVGEPATASVL